MKSDTLSITDQPVPPASVQVSGNLVIYSALSFPRAMNSLISPNKINVLSSFVLMYLFTKFSELTCNKYMDNQ